MIVSPARMRVDGLVGDRWPGGLRIFWGRGDPRLCFVLRFAFGEPRPRAPGATGSRPPPVGFPDVVGGWIRESGVRRICSVQSSGRGPTYVISSGVRRAGARRTRKPKRVSGG